MPRRRWWVTPQGRTISARSWTRILVLALLALLAVQLVAQQLSDTRLKTLDLSVYYEASALRSTGIQRLDLPKGRPIRIRIKTVFTPTSVDYPNVFQTGDSKNAVRLELTQPGKLNLVLTEANYISLPVDVALGRPNAVVLDIDGSAAQIRVGEHSRTFVVSGLLHKIDVSNFVVGSGYGRLRDFRGSIDEFAVAYGYEPRGLSRLLGFVALAISGFLFVAIAISVGERRESVITASTFPWRALGLLASSLVICVLAGSIASFLGGGARWVGYLIAGLVLLATLTYPVWRDDAKGG